ncbi:UNVERIFIED_CONTAM: hypothetical protein HDU68_006057 [Siphonaria sp. JEL0065]|nr:hypothetical protein HDU68_006057 [Siphonaria sp. JEL0065]
MSHADHPPAIGIVPPTPQPVVGQQFSWNGGSQDAPGGGSEFGPGLASAYSTPVCTVNKIYPKDQTPTGLNDIEYEENDDFLIATTMIEKIRDVIFSVMFFMVHGNSSPEIFEYISIIIEDLQLVTFFISPQVSHVYWIPDTLLHSQVDYQTIDLAVSFNAWFSVAVVAVFVLMLNIVWVGSGFVNGVRKRLSKYWSEFEVSYDYSTPEMLVFHTWTHVEIAARFITVNMSKRRTRIDFNAIPEIQQIFKRGIEEFPDEPLLRLSYALYMFHLKSMNRDATNQLNKIEQLNPPLDVKFQIYYTNQIATQSKEADFLGAGVKISTSLFYKYAEYQKTDKDAKLNHFLAIQEMRTMWELLLDKNYSLEELSLIANKLYTYAQKAQDSYMKLISKFPKSKNTLRFFARFCFDVTNDVLRGDALIDRANDLELEEEGDSAEDEPPATNVHRRESSNLSGIAVNRSPSNVMVVQKAALKRGMSIKSRVNVRQLQTAYSLNDNEKFGGIQNQLQKEMLNFSSVVEDLFATRDIREANNIYYTTPSVEGYISHYPLSELLYPTNISLFEYTRMFANSGLYVSNVSFSDFSNSDENNNIRWVLDNFWTAQHGPYDYSMNILYFATFKLDISNANQTIYILTGVHVFIVFLFLVVLDRSVRMFLTNQRHSLNIFRSIPKAIIKEIIEALTEADGDDIFSNSIVKQSQHLSNANAAQTSSSLFRIQYAIYAILMSVLSILFAYVNISSIYTIGQNFAILDQAGDMQTFQIRLVNLARELLDVDVKTWGNESAIRQHYLSDYDQISEVYASVKYGDDARHPPSPSYNAACFVENRRYNSSVGYIPNSVNLGLLHLTDYLASLHSDIANSCQTGPFKPPAAPIEFFEKVLEWDYLDGWHHVEEASYTETVSMLNNSIHMNIAIFALEMVLVFFGQFLVVSRMMNSFRFTDQCIFDLLNRLPAQVKTVPEIRELLVNNGIMAKTRNIAEDESNTPDKSAQRTSITQQVWSVASMIFFGSNKTPEATSKKKPAMKDHTESEQERKKVNFISPRVSVAVKNSCEMLVEDSAEYIPHKEDSNFT